MLCDIIELKNISLMYVTHFSKSPPKYVRWDGITDTSVVFLMMVTNPGANRLYEHKELLVIISQ